MIGYLKGNILHAEPAYVLLEVSNIGYEVKISLKTFEKIKNETNSNLFIYQHLREDTNDLYGFLTMEEKKCFLSLLDVKGIGPNAALSIISSYDVKSILNAITTGDVNLFKSIKGIGIKVAQRIILELKDKAANLVSTIDVAGSSNNQYSTKSEAISALVALGINRTAAEKTVQQIILELGPAISVEELIKLALKK